MSTLVSVLKEQFPHAAIQSVKRKYGGFRHIFYDIYTQRYFNEASGASYIQKLCVPEYATCLTDVESKYYCLATTAAIIKYIEFIQGIFYAVHSLKFVFQGPEKTLMIGRDLSRLLAHLQLILHTRYSNGKTSRTGLQCPHLLQSSALGWIPWLHIDLKWISPAPIRNFAAFMRFIQIIGR